MKHLDTYSTSKRLLGLLLGISIALPLPSLAATVDLATKPLAVSNTGKVLPNVLFIMDDSGSMDDDALPDWANTSTTSLFKNTGYNGLAYDPATRYYPPTYYNSDGSLNTTTYPSQTGGSTATGADTAFSTPNWRKVKDDAYGVQSTSTSDLVGSASFYTFIAGEYCTATDLKTCVSAAAASTTHPYPATLRWCSSSALTTTTCQKTKTATYQYARYSGMPSTATVKVNSSTAANTVSQITVDGKNIMSAAAPGDTNESNVASSIRDAINACTSAITGSCTVAGYSATRSSTTVTITSPSGAGAITFTPAVSGAATTTVTAFTGGTPGTNVLTNIVSSTTSYPYPGTTTKASGRSDCTADTTDPKTCTYAEEMTNYANWWTYYHTRMQAMKTSVSRAFKEINETFRVGYSSISNTGATDGTEFLHIDKFQTAHKNTWYTKLFAADPSGYTPLRSALAKAGKVFAHKLDASAPDPMQFSCQQNFTILSTDGYWNKSSEYGTLSLDGGNVGNMDGGSTTRAMYEGPTAVSDSLADISKYYYDTDLRTTALGNCTGSADDAGATHDVCENNVYVSSTDNNLKQHMTTFTMGLGVDGLLDFYSDYTSVKKDDTSSTPPVTYAAPTGVPLDWYNLLNGYGSPIVNWPDPNVASTSNTVTERIDDLWHAAVNGRGTYFSAKKPDEIVSGFNKALASISSKIGAGAAAATSTLNPVAGDNYAYVASYTTAKWTGNLEARTIDITTGIISESASWCAEDVVASTCAAPSYLTTETVASSTVHYCVTPSSTAATCSGILDGTDCKVEASTSCTGTMAAKVSASGDTRTIKMNVGGTLQDFNYGNITAAGLSSYFSSSCLSGALAGCTGGLTQWASLDTTQQAAAVGANLVNFLRGQYGYEDRGTTATTNRLYRYREAVLGDAVESKPAFVAKPTFSYTDPGYDAFKAAQASRAGTVYMGTNDGMLHAFNSSSGQERWAYVPTMVIPNMWVLADKSYSSKHRYFVNGGPVISDVCSSGCSGTGAVWRTILVGGLNGGGRGYYALDITDPASPTLLWEFTTSSDDDLGYSFGNPVITKKADGTWVVLITSGYNNTTGTHPGKGVLYVLNPMTGAKIATYLTSAGDATTPSGLAKINAWADNGEKNNTATYTYGGDLLGNLWRFDINSAAVAGTNPLKLATLFSDAAGTLPQPITTRPELGNINDKRVVFVGTGKYLETGDLTNTQLQTLYAIKDDDETSTLVNPRTTLVAQTLTTSGASRTVTSNTVDFSTGRGWYVDFPESKERQNVDSLLVLGTLLVPTTVPSNTDCSPGGTGWLNYFDYKTGGAVTGSGGVVSTYTNAPIVGINVLYIGGQPKVSVVTADHPTPDPIDGPKFNTSASGFQQKRVIWRELIQ